MVNSAAYTNHILVSFTVTYANIVYHCYSKYFPKSNKPIINNFVLMITEAEPNYVHNS